ncbi:glycosyltransferase family 2 protein [Psychroserpens sp. XS_ASV72]|uniref:glycosyltransferase family 2 protein n=1 Tax=Psychroserpens sp. XS_ASV72 TaxID=3241293 RepID=UPI0035193FD4
MKLSVVILNYNVRYFLELCLKSVQASIKNLDAEIIVVDNNSSDDSCAMVRSQFPEIKLIENQQNLGFSKGNNIGVSKAKGHYVCILNPDTVVAEDTFEKALAFADSKEDLGALGCRLIDGKGQFLPESKRYVPTPNVAIKKMLGFTDSYYVKTLNEHKTGSVPILVGAFMLLKKKVYVQVNGFDEDYFMYGDDIDLSYKIEKAGYHNYYFGTSTVIHYKGESTLKNKEYAQRFYGAMQIFYLKYFTSNVIFNIMVWFGVRLATWFQKPPKNKPIDTKRVVFISNSINKDLKHTLKKELLLETELKVYQDNTEYILDNNYLSFKSIIEILSNTPKNCNATFKILPKKATFIVGSNSSKSRGEIIHLSQN